MCHMPSSRPRPGAVIILNGNGFSLFTTLIMVQKTVLQIACVIYRAIVLLRACMEP
jgi:hypothetical protein